MIVSVIRICIEVISEVIWIVNSSMFLLFIVCYVFIVFYFSAI